MKREAGFRRAVSPRRQFKRRINDKYRTGNICCRSEAMKRYIGTCLPHAGRYMQSRTGAVTQVSILPQSFFCYCRITFLLLPHHFFAFAASFFSFHPHLRHRNSVAIQLLQTRRQRATTISIEDCIF